MIKDGYDHCGFCENDNFTCNVNAGERIVKVLYSKYTFYENIALTLNS